jgi:hypothetical protein
MLALTFFLLASTLMALTNQRPVIAQDTKTIVYTTAYGMGDKGAAEMVTWLEAQGHTVIHANTGINDTILTGADALLLGPFYGPQGGIDELNSTNAPAFFNPIKTWWESGGGKLIWVSGDNDYVADWVPFNCSKILEEIGSVLRFEPAEAQERPTGFAGWDDGNKYYRCVPNTTADNAISQRFMEGVNLTLFHGPTVVYGLDGTTPVQLQTTTLPNVYPVLIKDDQGIIGEVDPTTGPIAHTLDQVGPLVMTAVEMFAGPESNSKIIASGSGLFGGYEPIWKGEYHTVTLGGPKFCQNALTWGLEVEAPVVGLDPLLIGGIAAAAIIIVVIIVVVVWIRRR